MATDQKKTGCISSSVKRLVTGVIITVPRRYRYQRMQRVKEGVARYIKKPSQLKSHEGRVEDDICSGVFSCEATTSPLPYKRT